jgi:uncharacterized protein
MRRWVTCIPTVVLLSSALVFAEGPTFNCKSKDLGSVEQKICADAQLSDLDRELAVVFEKARALDAKSVQGTLPAEQRGWIKGRNECWKDSDLRACCFNSYVRRISELQARYRLVTPDTSVSYICDNNPAHELVVTYFATKQKVAVVEHGDSAFTLFLDSGENSNRYQGRNETLTLEASSVQFVPVYEAPPLRCVSR